MRILYTKLAVLFFVLTSCSDNLTKTSSGKKIDNRLVGVWTGSEQGQQYEGAQKFWEMTRNQDGTFLLNFKTIADGQVYEHTETGNWWIKNGKFHEFHNDSGETDIYRYAVLDNSRVKFISKNIKVEMNSKNYEFVDTRK